MENDLFLLAEEKKKRYERKFFLESFGFPSLKSLIKFHPSCFKKHYPARQVNSIYLDSFDKKSYSDNIAGIDQRIKTRIRWYGENINEIHIPILEFKIKSGFLGRKLHYSFPGFNREGNLDKNIRLAARGSDLPDFIKLYLARLKCSSINSYLRQYYLSSDKRFRLTIDSDIRFYKADNKLIERDKSNLIVELKYDEEYDADARIISSKFPFRMTKSSKYVTGVEKMPFYFS
ncbi:MAG: VTC domain-containing protein [bacterium]|nr:VTC domain-containing protein [bacterium]